MALVLAAVLAVLVLVYASDSFVRFLAKAAAGQLPSEVIFELLVLKLLSNLELLLPLAFFLAVLLALGRLHQDSEIVALTAAGVGPTRLARMIAGGALLMAAVTAVLSFYLSPMLNARQDAVLSRARGQVQMSGFAPGKFTELDGGRQTVYAGAIAPDRKALYRVFVQVRHGEGRRDVMSAARAHIERAAGGRYMVLEDGYRYTGTPGMADYVVSRYARYGVLIGGAPIEATRALGSMPTLVLWRLGGRARLAELQWRASLPLSLVLLAVLAVPLARTTPRQGRYAKLFTAILAYFLYSDALSIGEKLIARGALPGVLGLWPVHVVVAVVVAWLLWRDAGGGWRALWRRGARRAPA